MRKNHLFALCLGLLFTIHQVNFAQVNEETMDGESKNFTEQFFDEMDNEEKGVYTLRFFDAVDGKPLKEASVLIKDKGTFTTDIEGKVQFPIDDYTTGRFLVSVKKEGYIPADYSVQVEAGTLFYNRFSISPVLDLGSIRVVLEWENSPNDLDAHLLKENGFHISYHDKLTLADGMGGLDIDDRDGYGPETITLNDVDENGKYLYFVHNYSNIGQDNSKKLSKCKAVVRVYADNSLKYSLEVPQGKTGTVWKVFQIENGKYSVINTIE